MPKLGRDNFNDLDRCFQDKIKKIWSLMTSLWRQWVKGFLPIAKIKTTIFCPWPVIMAKFQLKLFAKFHLAKKPFQLVARFKSSQAYKINKTQVSHKPNLNFWWEFIYWSKEFCTRQTATAMLHSNTQMNN